MPSNNNLQHLFTPVIPLNAWLWQLPLLWRFMGGYRALQCLQLESGYLKSHINGLDLGTSRAEEDPARCITDPPAMPERSWQQPAELTGWRAIH